MSGSLLRLAAKEWIIAVPGCGAKFPERFPVEAGEGICLAIGGPGPGWAGGTVEGGEALDGSGE